VSCILVCFAVPEEAKPFRRSAAGARPEVQVLVSGMGQTNAAKALQDALGAWQPTLVLTTGFAGALRPGLECGALVFDADSTSGLEPGLIAAGALRAKFHCLDRVASTAREKQALWETTKADAVEMESGVIRALCCAQGIPSATLRVILDTAAEDLPLDFNALLTPDCRLSAGKLALALMRSPGRIPALRRLQKQTAAAADRLSAGLNAVLGQTRS
jgi:nucleoside phosphorylase